MNPEDLTVAEIAQKRRQEAIERINSELYQSPQASSIPVEDISAKVRIASPDLIGAPGYIAPDGTYVPNQIPVRTRILNSLMSLGMIVYGYIGIRLDDLFVPGKRGGIHLHSVSAWVMYAAMLCASAHLAAVVIDHYDRRNNERYYQQFGRLSQWVGWTLFVLSLVAGLTVRQMNSR